MLFDERCREKRSREEDAWERIDVSRGMAVYDPKEDETVNDVVRRADKLMYEHKWKRKHNMDSEQESLRDELTGLKTRSALRQDFEMFVGIPLHIMILAPDDFRQLNKTKGHEYCDGILATVGKTLAECFHRCHSYRYGADEFLVIGENEPEKDFSGDCERAGKLLEASDIRFFAGYIFGEPAGIQDLRNMITLADEVMKEAKEEGKERFIGKEYHARP